MPMGYMKLSVCFYLLFIWGSC